VEPDPALALWLDRLEKIRCSREALAASLRESYRVEAAMLDAMAQGGVGYPGFFDVSGMPDFRRRIVFHPNRTRGRIADLFRGVLAGVRPAGEMKSRFVALRNVEGERYCEIVALFCKEARRSPEQVNARIAAARLLYSLRRYRAVRGALPERLEDLVPEFAKELPIDPFDGKPLRYSKEEGIVWSVGEQPDAIRYTIDPVGPP
jgi:hypothetical protein